MKKIFLMMFALVALSAQADRVVTSPFYVGTNSELVIDRVVMTDTTTVIEAHSRVNCIIQPGAIITVDGKDYPLKDAVGINVGGENKKSTGGFKLIFEGKIPESSTRMDFYESATGWKICDIRIDGSRPRGLVDDYRRPAKDAATIQNDYQRRLENEIIQLVALLIGFMIPLVAVWVFMRYRKKEKTAVLEYVIKLAQSGQTLTPELILAMQSQTPEKGKTLSASRLTIAIAGIAIALGSLIFVRQDPALFAAWAVIGIVLFGFGISQALARIINKKLEKASETAEDGQI